MNWLATIQSRLRALFQKRKLDAEMDEEMRSHIEMRAQSNMEAGMKPEEARFAALRQFGWTESIKEECREQRGVRWLEDLVQDLSFGARQLGKNSGFTAAATVEPSSTRPQVTLREIMEAVGHQPGVRLVAAASKLPQDGGGARTQAVSIQNRRPPAAGAYPTADFQGVTPDYFRAMGIPMLLGRSFTESDVYEAPGVVIINEAMARRYFPNENPVGRRLAMGDRQNLGQPASPNPGERSPWKEIVGVAGDLKNLGANPEAVPTVYFSYWQWPMQSPTLVARTSVDPAAIAAGIRTAVKSINKNLPDPSIRTMDQVLSDSVARPRFQAVLANLLGIAALLLAAVGTYGVMAYSVAQRTREIGVRLALGAQRSTVLSMVIRQGMRLGFVGVVIGLALAVALSRIMSSLLYEITPTDPMTFASISAVLLAVVLFACWLPARRAAKVDPMVALRHE
jgi:putative ABC transport system permease protein